MFHYSREHRDKISSPVTEGLSNPQPYELQRVEKTHLVSEFGHKDRSRKYENWYDIPETWKTRYLFVIVKF